MLQTLDLKPNNRKLRAFAAGMAFLSLLIFPLGSFVVRKSTLDEPVLKFLSYSIHQWSLILAITFFTFFLFCRYWNPMWLKPLYIFWSILSVAIGFIVGPIILSVFYFGILSPLAVISRATGKIWLKTHNQESYWQPLPPHKPESFEQLF